MIMVIPLKRLQGTEIKDNNLDKHDYIDIF